ncbi:putative leader peptide [Streptacidiphilus anmyonensis]|uniref:putative leader peptide n=1 Tax=Streptacidiphilus anmyonensis TaxID=405782 RepID=UPI0034E1E25A
MAPEKCEVIRMVRAACSGNGRASRLLASLLSVTRRHVDLLRVSSALCPGSTALV